ncbi:decapping 5-like protein isoform X2 [Salvia splendens]|uniref:decapping 5-like protein isoform X2 n=1 Tax=Salvia splendens TaxID=180675 RepID=UPI001C264F8D|nr:decapping 5-like protein isoform X2 [Salvia splendens]
MSKEPSCNANNATSQPSPSSAGDSFIGSFISVMSKSEIRYEGILYFLNPQDSTFGLKDVRTFGTEGRRNDGKEVPPSDRVFEYILFRGSDIKDVKVITNPLVQKQEKLHNDPAIIESNYHIPPYSSSHSVSPVPGYSTESKFHSESSGLNARSHLNMLPSNPSGSQMGWGSSQSTHSGSSSYDIPTGPTQWQGYHAAPGGTSIAQQHPLSSAPMTHLLQNPASTAMAMTNMPDFVPSGNSLSSEQSQPLYNSTTINSRGLTQPLPLAYQNTGSIEAQAANKVVPDHASALPAQFLPYSASSGMGQISNSFLGAPNPSHPRLSEYSMSNNLYAEPNDVTGTSSNSPNFLSSAAGPAVHPPLLPLPPTAQKLQSPLQFTEEFDFEAMNEKFKKEEVWGYLGKANQRENIDGMQSAINSQEFGDDKLDLISKSDPKPAYSKDDFFDTISCNSLGWGTRDGQNQLSERVKLNSETFGYFERRSQFGYGGQRSGHGQHRGPYNWGRGYNYGYRGHGRYT